MTRHTTPEIPAKYRMSAALTAAYITGHKQVKVITTGLAGAEREAYAEGWAEANRLFTATLERDGYTPIPGSPITRRLADGSEEDITNPPADLPADAHTANADGSHDEMPTRADCPGCGHPGWTGGPTRTLTPEGWTGGPTRMPRESTPLGMSRRKEAEDYALPYTTNPLDRIPTQEEAMRLLTTTRPRVVPAPREAMHIDGGNGQTLCGVRISDNYGTPVDTTGRISCIRCGRIADAEGNL